MSKSLHFDLVLGFVINLFCLRDGDTDAAPSQSLYVGKLAEPEAWFSDGLHFRLGIKTSKASQPAF